MILRSTLIFVAYFICLYSPHVSATNSSGTVVSNNRYTGSFESLKYANSREIYNICLESKTTAKMLDWIVENQKMRHCYSELLRHPNLSPDTIEKIIGLYKGNPSDDVYEAFVQHPNTRDETRSAIIDTAIADIKSFSKVVQSVARLKGELTVDAEKLLREITFSEDQHLRREAAKSPRLPADLLEYFVNTEEIHIRQHVAYNPQLSLSQLSQLANDKYKPVQTAAISVIKNRFPEHYNEVRSSFTQEAGSSKLASLQQVLTEAIKNKDINTVEHLIVILKKYQLELYYSAGLGPAIETNDIEFVTRIHEAFPQDYLIYDLANDNNFDIQWLKYFYEHGWLKRFNDFSLMHAMVKNNRWVLYWRLVIEGYEVNPTNPDNNRSLLSVSLLTSTFVFMLPIVVPLVLIAGCILYVLIMKKTSTVTTGIMVLSSLVFLPAISILVIAIGLGCWGCSNPFSGVSYIILLWLVLIALYYFLSRKTVKTINKH
ncbi:MAG: hypothetical protein ISR69_12175 [Gammaproteobacteria bacterium]|nr:hypothetical protein [Gammaproteobacteria bacterium]